MNALKKPVKDRDRGKLCFITCDSGRAFGGRIFTELERIYQIEEQPEKPLWADSTEVWFPNREVKTVIECNIRGDDVYIVQCMDDPLAPGRSPNDNFFALASAIDAVRQSDADTITAVIPQFPYSRQERKKGREGITARLTARFLELAGADRVLTLDLHAEAISGFFQQGLLENLHASRVLIQEFERIYFADNPDLPLDRGFGGRLMVVSPDVGSADRARFFAKVMGTELAVVDKKRDYSRPGTVEAMRLVGDVHNQDVFMADDMISTGGTLLLACQHLKKMGARKIYLATALPFLNGKAVELFTQASERGEFECLLVTDAVYRGEAFGKSHPWYREVSIAPLFAKVIHNINKKRSVSELIV